MILVTLGTQDKPFDRLLKAIDKEIEKENIKDEVIVQAGTTKYESSNMKVFDLIPLDEMQKLVKKADIIITHAGVGAMLDGIRYNKKVIATARLKEYGEHDNDHQLQILDIFNKKGYIIALYDFDKLAKKLKEAKRFKPKKFESNTKNMMELIEKYIESDMNFRMKKVK